MSREVIKQKFVPLQAFKKEYEFRKGEIAGKRSDQTLPQMSAELYAVALYFYINEGVGSLEEENGYHKLFSSLQNDGATPETVVFAIVSLKSFDGYLHPYKSDSKEVTIPSRKHMAAYCCSHFGEKYHTKSGVLDLSAHHKTTLEDVLSYTVHELLKAKE